jgi:plasmid stabilization system protein ParE
MGQPEKYKLIWTRTASADLMEIVEFIAEDSSDRALAILDEIERVTARLSVLPLRGRVVPELAVFGIRNYRQIVYSPWRIIYRVAGREVIVFAVLDSRRHLEDILLARLLRE